MISTLSKKTANREGMAGNRYPHHPFKPSNAIIPSRTVSSGLTPSVNPRHQDHALTQDPAQAQAQAQPPRHRNLASQLISHGVRNPDPALTRAAGIAGLHGPRAPARHSRREARPVQGREEGRPPQAEEAPPVRHPPRQAQVRGRAAARRRVSTLHPSAHAVFRRSRGVEGFC